MLVEGDFVVIVRVESHLQWRKRQYAYSKASMNNMLLVNRSDAFSSRSRRLIQSHGEAVSLETSTASLLSCEQPFEARLGVVRACYPVGT